MELTILLQIILFTVLIVLSGFFSSSETALFSLNRVQLEGMRREKHPRYPLIQHLLNEPRRLIVTILIGNELVNVAASNISATLIMHFMGGEGKWWVNLFVMLPLLLLFGEITPKTLAVRNNVAFSAFLAPLVSLFSTFIHPLRLLVRWVADFFTTLLIGKPRSRGNIVTEDMVRTLAHQATVDGVLDKSEQRLIDNIFDFGNQRVREVMTPRGNIFSLTLDAPFPQWLQDVKERRISRIPVFHGHADRVAGVLHLRDLIGKDLAPFSEAEALESILRKPFLIPESKPVADLFRTFRERRTSIALVVDEFGGVTGMVTMEDLLESIFGQIREVTGDVSPESLGEGCFRIDGAMPVSSFNEEMGTHLRHDEVQTMGGLLLHVHGELPEVGTKVTVEGKAFTVAKVEENRILEILFSKGEAEACTPHVDAVPASDGAGEEA